MNTNDINNSLNNNDSLIQNKQKNSQNYVMVEAETITYLINSLEEFNKKLDEYKILALNLDEKVKSLKNDFDTLSKINDDIVRLAKLKIRTSQN